MEIIITVLPTRLFLEKLGGRGGENSDLLKVSHLGQTMVQAMSKCLALSIALFISYQKYLLSV